MENYTKIPNDILENLIRLNLSSTAYATFFFILRKINGYHKEEDSISNSQIANGIDRSVRSVISATNELRVVKILSLVKKGSPPDIANVWAIEKDVTKWGVVKKSSVLKQASPRVVKKSSPRVVKKSSHTKETNTRNRKKEDFSYKKFIDMFNELKNSRYGYADKKAQGQFNQLLKAGVTEEMFKHAISNAKSDRYLIENPKYLTPEYITRVSQFEKWVNAKPFKKSSDKEMTFDVL